MTNMFDDFLEQTHIRQKTKLELWIEESEKFVTFKSEPSVFPGIVDNPLIVSDVDAALINIIRQHAPSTLAQSFVNVQPMVGNVGEVFTMRHNYKKKQNVFQRIFGKFFRLCSKERTA